jgi:hypothetical protein
MRTPLVFLVLLSAASVLSAGCNDTAVEPEFAFQAAIIDGEDHGARPLSAHLTGPAEVPVPGDPDGSGHATVTLNQGQGEVCFEISVSDIEPARAAHIHVGAAGTPGPVVVGLAAPSTGWSSGCVSDVDRELIKAIRQNPAGYYVNVHNAQFPGGALRGQLSK